MDPYTIQIGTVGPATQKVDFEYEIYSSDAVSYVHYKPVMMGFSPGDQYKSRTSGEVEIDLYLYR